MDLSQSITNEQIESNREKIIKFEGEKEVKNKENDNLKSNNDVVKKVTKENMIS